LQCLHKQDGELGLSYACVAKHRNPTVRFGLPLQVLYRFHAGTGMLDEWRDIQDRGNSGIGDGHIDALFAGQLRDLLIEREKVFLLQPLLATLHVNPLFKLAHTFFQLAVHILQQFQRCVIACAERWHSQLPFPLLYREHFAFSLGEQAKKKEEETSVEFLRLSAIQNAVPVLESLLEERLQSECFSRSSAPFACIDKVTQLFIARFADEGLK
jgi:hypothetical protein